MPKKDLLKRFATFLPSKSNYTSMACAKSTKTSLIFVVMCHKKPFQFL